MLKILLTSVVLMGALYANSGENVYKTKCIACHQMKGMMDMSEMKKMREKMQGASAQEKKSMKAAMKKKESGMRAPAMNMVSMRIKKMKPTKEAFIAFVEDYIQNPSQKKGVCMPMAYKRFGTMPPIGKGMSKEDRKLVATWLYENFSGSWDDSMGGAMCKNNNKKSMKCGAGKCGSK